MTRLTEIENEIDRLLAAQSDWTPLARTLAAEVDARDEVITKLLAMLEPGSGQLGHIEDDKTISLTIAEWNLLVSAHHRACEIAGRTE